MHKQQGFSLIELVVAGAVLAVFAAMIIPQISVLSDHADHDKIQTNLQTLDMSLQLYEQQYHQYPATAGGLAVVSASVPIPADIVLSEYSYAQTSLGYQLTHLASGSRSPQSKP